jgi:hypothetical protein
VTKEVFPQERTRDRPVANHSILRNGESFPNLGYCKSSEEPHTENECLPRIPLLEYRERHVDGNHAFELCIVKRAGLVERYVFRAPAPLLPQLRSRVINKQVLHGGCRERKQVLPVLCSRAGLRKRMYNSFASAVVCSVLGHRREAIRCAIRRN